MPHFDGKVLPEIMRRQLKDRGVAAVAVNHVVSSLVQTSLRGVDSHGINLFPHYCKAVDVGRINNKPKIKITKTAASTAVVDADHAFGHHAGAEAMDVAMTLAKKTGVGAAAVKNSTHFGAAAYFGLRAAEKGYLGLAFTNADALVKAHAAKEAFFGTNPICFTAPMEKEGPFCLDMATSIVSWNKIRTYRNANKQVPENWVFDKDGAAVTDPHAAKCLSPIGDYKGFGLGMVVDVLCSLLSGGLISKDIMPMYVSYNSTKRRIGHFFMAIDIAKFINPKIFKKSLQQMADRLRALEPLSRDTPVLVAGDPEKISFVQRSKAGIPIDEAKAKEFFELSPDFKRAVLRDKAIA